MFSFIVIAALWFSGPRWVRELPLVACPVWGRKAIAMTTPKVLEITVLYGTPQDAEIVALSGSGDPPNGPDDWASLLYAIDCAVDAKRDAIEANGCPSVSTRGATLGDVLDDLFGDARLDN